MPIETVEIPGGRRVQIEVPEGATDDQILAFVKQQYDAGAFEPIPPASYALGAGEVGLAGVTGSLGQIAGGLSGIAALPYTGVKGAAELSESIQEQMTYEPRTRGGQRIAGLLGQAGQAVGEFLTERGVPTPREVGIKTLGATGSPVVAAAAETGYQLIPALLGGAVAQGLRPRTKLLTPTGEPTRDLRDILQSQGLTFEALTPETRAQIPAELPPVVSGRQLARTGEQITEEELRTGSRQAGLAPQMLEGPRGVRPDPLAAETIKQGFDPGFVQAVKTATPDTQNKMRQMLSAMENIKANRRAAQGMRPSDIAGQSVINRVKFVREKADEAATQLGEIARNRFPGQAIDPTPVVNVLNDTLNRLDIRVTGTTSVGKPLLDFSDSIVSQDPSTKRVIQQAVDLMAQGGAPDALRAHNLKRQLDSLIDYRKSSQRGLTAEGQRFLKNLRATLNRELRTLDPEYARVNDVLSKTFDVFDDLQVSAGQKVDLFDPSADRMVGQQLRRLFSNTQARVGMEDAIRDLDNWTKDLGGDFNDSAYDLAMFATNLDKKFGAVAETSFQGSIESAVQRAAQAAQEGITPTAASMAAEKIKETAQGFRNINEYEAFRSMEELLKRGANQ